jgi:Tol biopolymer transport system component/DNA-binding winged helix-turn-helix (wHTH) protein
MDVATYRFEDVSVDRRRLAVSRGGVRVELEPKALDVLLYLIDHRDRLVTKDELLDQIWKDTFVTPNVLTRVIAQIRKALGDDADRPRIIETVQKRGYRVIATVVAEFDRAAESSGSDPTDRVHADRARHGGDGAGSPRPARATASRRWALISVAVVAVIVTAAAIWASTMSREPTARPTSVRRLTTRAGFNGQPAVSPDGRSFAYVSDRTGWLEIFVTGPIATGTEVQLTSNGGQNMHPAWSPDGRWIAFHSRRFGGIWVVASGGGQPQQIATLGSSPSWSPDSRQLVFTSDTGGFAGQAALWTVDRDGGNQRQLTTLEQTPGGALGPSWSHNGKLIAFTNLLGGGAVRPGLFVLSLADNQIRQIFTGSVQGAARFGPDDEAVYWLGIAEGNTVALRRVAIDPDTGTGRGSAETVLPIDGLAEGLTISASGVAAFGSARDDDNFWSVEIDRGGNPGEPVRVTNDIVRNTHPSFSPDGHLAYMQIVPGEGPFIWILPPDGSPAKALLPGVSASEPLWSADGKRLFTLQGDRAVWVDLATRRTEEIPIAVPRLRPAFPNLSPDNRSLAYHRIEANGQMSVWIAPLDGGPERRVAADPEGVGFPLWSPDGRSLAVEKRVGDQSHVGIVPADGSGTIQDIVTDPGNNWPNDWSADGRRLVYAAGRGGVWNIREVAIATKASRPLTNFTLPIGYVRYPLISPDGRRVVFERAIRTSSVWTMVIE